MILVLRNWDNIDIGVVDNIEKVENDELFKLQVGKFDKRNEL